MRLSGKLPHPVWKAWADSRRFAKRGQPKLSWTPWHRNDKYANRIFNPQRIPKYTKVKVLPTHHLTSFAELRYCCRCLIKSFPATGLPEYLATHSQPTGYLRPCELDRNMFKRKIAGDIFQKNLFAQIFREISRIFDCKIFWGPPGSDTFLSGRVWSGRVWSGRVWSASRRSVFPFSCLGLHPDQNAGSAQGCVV